MDTVSLILFREYQFPKNEVAQSVTRMRTQDQNSNLPPPGRLGGEKAKLYRMSVFSKDSDAVHMCAGCVFVFSASLWRRDLLGVQRKKPGLTEVPCSRSHTQWTPEWKCGNLWRLFHLNAPVP